MSEEIAEVSVETTEVDWQERAKKAEAKIVELKQSKQEVPQIDDTFLDKKLEERDFFKSNPDLNEHRDKILDYTSKGISFEKAKTLVEMDDPTIVSRKVSQHANFTSWEVPMSNAISQEEIAKLPLERRAKVYQDIKAGKVKLTN